jgi:hypothetical protein
MKTVEKIAMKCTIDYNPKSNWTKDFIKSIEVELTREEIETILGYKIKIVKQNGNN